MTQMQLVQAPQAQAPMQQISNRQAPWCGVGVRGRWTDYREALAAADMDFYVVPKEARTMLGQNASYVSTVVPGIQVNVRQGVEEKIVGVVSDRYGIVQNEDAFSMLEPFVQAGGVITNAGYTEQGLHFMVLRMQKTRILGDEYDVDVMCTNSFNGSFPCALIVVPMRIICQNMYRGLMGKGHDFVHVFRHGSQVGDRMAAMNQASGKVLSFMGAFELQLEAAYASKMMDSDIKLLIEHLFPYPKPGGTRELMSRERVDFMRNEFYEQYYLASDNDKFKGTGMGFINAYYDYLSHRNPTKNMSGSWESRRLSGLVSGNDVKVGVIQEAM